jgi:CheY-like chemotaxis protein
MTSQFLQPLERLSSGIPGLDRVLGDSILKAVDRSSAAREGASAVGEREGHETAVMNTIVVVDDEFGLADALAVTLSDVGYHVVAVGDGVRGLQAMRENPPALVLLDYMMPILDGPGVLAAMRADPALVRVPVILMSAVPEAVVRQRAEDYAAFLRKPFDYGTLLAAVSGILPA